jgi:tetratricopeptide (TPR) repeat protein
MKRIFVLAFPSAVLALSLLASCATSRPQDQLRFGIWASERSLWDEAIFRWKKAAEANPKSAAAHNNLAVAYEKKGLFEDALKEYGLALKLDPENSYVKSNYKNCQENIQFPEKEGKGKKDEKK